MVCFVFFFGFFFVFFFVGKMILDWGLNRYDGLIAMVVGVGFRGNIDAGFCGYNRGVLHQVVTKEERTERDSPGL